MLVATGGDGASGSASDMTVVGTSTVAVSAALGVGSLALAGPCFFFMI